MYCLPMHPFQLKREVVCGDFSAKKRHVDNLWLKVDLGISVIIGESRISGVIVFLSV